MGTLVPRKVATERSRQRKPRWRAEEDEQRRAEATWRKKAGGELEEGVNRQEEAEHRLQGTNYRKHRF